MLRTPERILVGRIVSTQGLLGEMRIQPLTDFPERFSHTEEVLARHPSGREIVLHPVRARPHKNIVLLTCREFTTIDQVKPWLQSELSIAAEQLQPLPEGRFYIFQIIGLQVYTEEGLHLGVVTDVLSPGANDVYVVKLSPEAAKLAVESDGKELLLPVIDQVIIETNLAQERLTVRLLDGLL